MSRENLELELRSIRHLLSHLHGEVTTLEQSYTQVLAVLHRLDGVVATDDLTGLLRRNSFFKKWDFLLEQCERLEQTCGVMIIDIDHFKKINDQYGHATGDEVIKRVASLLKQYENENCIVGRLGGEEFIIAHAANDAETLGLAEYIRRGAERTHGPVMDEKGNPNEKIQWKCTLSVGFTSTRKDGFKKKQLLEAADRALFVAKNKGRNQVRAA